MNIEEDYLISLDPGSIPELRCRVLVIGSGIAGLSAALSAAKDGRVVLIAKDSLDETATAYAQGGIAAAIAEGDTPQKHLEDTLIAGQGAM